MMHHWISNLMKAGSESEMLEGCQKKTDAMAGYFAAVFSQEPLLDKELESTKRLLTVCFD